MENKNLTEKAFKSNNEGYISGTIVSENINEHLYEDNRDKKFDERFLEIMVATKRLSGVEDVIPVTISAKLVPDESTLKTGCTFTARGEFRSYDRYESDGHRKHYLHFFVKEVLSNELVDKDKINKIELRGFLCKPPIYRVTPFNREITDLSLAVNRKRDADYIPLIVWGRNAQYAKSLKVGDFICVEGRMQSRAYQKKIDENTTESRTAYEVSVAKITEPENEVENPKTDEVELAAL